MAGLGLPLDLLKVSDDLFIVSIFVWKARLGRGDKICGGVGVAELYLPRPVFSNAFLSWAGKGCGSDVVGFLF